MPQVPVQPPEPPCSWGASGAGTCSWALLRCFPAECFPAQNIPFPFSFAQGNAPLPPCAAGLGQAELLTGAAVKQQFSCSSSCIQMPSRVWNFLLGGM